MCSFLIKNGEFGMFMQSLAYAEFSRSSSQQEIFASLLLGCDLLDTLAASSCSCRVALSQIWSITLNLSAVLFVNLTTDFC